MTFDTGKNRAAALAMTDRGWHILPCHSVEDGACTCGKDCGKPGKHPIPRNGLKDARCDPDWARAVWEERPEANIGVRTGPESRLWVLDVDGEAGIKDLERLEAEYGPLPRTPTVRTGSGGRHYYLAWPAQVEVRNSTKIGGRSIDVRGANGYVIAPPSLHVKGGYAWEISPEEAPLAEAPAWLLELVTKRAATVEGMPALPAGPQEVDVFASRPGLDLDSAPGVAQGGRHNRACQLIGIHLARGEHPEAVKPKGRTWGKKCSPPMDADEIHSIVDSLARKDAERFEAELEAQPDTRRWPELDEAALYGLAGEVVRAIEPSPEADRVAILAQSLVFFGNVVGRGPHFVVESTSHHTNLFAVLVGQTAKGRKGTSEGRVRRLFRLVDPDWASGRLLGGASSGEGLITNVRDPIRKMEAIKENSVITEYKEMIVDNGIADKRLLARESEFASVLKVIRREGNILTTTIRDAWDSGDLRVMTKNSPTQATGAHISIVGHITQEELRRSLADVEGFNGFANRFIWLCVKRSKLLPEGGPEVDLQPFVDRLSRVVAFASASGEMSRDKEARARWAEIYKELSASHPGMFGAVTGRGEAQVLRLSMLYALLDESTIIRAEHLEAARALWMYAEDSARYIFGDSTGDPVADKVLAIIRTGPVTTKVIHDRTNRHLSAGEIKRVLDNLKAQRLIKSEKVPTGGRPADRWSLA